MTYQSSLLHDPIAMHCYNLSKKYKWSYETMHQAADIMTLTTMLFQQHGYTNSLNLVLQQNYSRLGNYQPKFYDFN